MRRTLIVLMLTTLAVFANAQPQDHDPGAQTADPAAQANSTAPTDSTVQPATGNQLRDWRTWGFVVAFLGLALTYIKFIRGEQKDRVDRESEVIPWLNEAWDLLGGKEGADSINHAVEDRSERVKAKRLIERALHKAPKYVKCYHHKGVLLFLEGKFREAEKTYRQAVKVDSKRALAYTGLAGTLFAQDILEEAERHYRRALELDPKFALAHTGLGAVFLRQGDPAKAETSYRQAVRFDPILAQTHLGLGNALRALGRLEEAEASFRRTLEIDSNYVEARTALKLVLREQGKPEEPKIEPEYRELNLGEKMQRARSGLSRRF